MRPQVFWCLDEMGATERWVLKMQGLANSELAADWVGSLVAHRLGVRCPQVDVANVSLEALQTAPPDVQAWAKVRLAFASKELSGSVAVQTDSDLLEFVSAEFIGIMFALDTWLEVLDRKKPDGIWNLLLHTSEEIDNEGRAVAVDFGKGLTACMYHVLGGAPQPVIPNYPLGVRRAASIEAAMKTCTAIESLPEDDIIEIVQSIPGDWINDYSKQQIHAHLVGRANSVRAVCSQLHNEAPGWN